MLEFFTLYTTPLLVGVIEYFSDFSTWLMFGCWVYVMIKTVLGSVATCLENANQARNVHRTMLALMCTCDLVALCTLAALDVYDPRILAILVGMDLSSYLVGILPYFQGCRCPRFFCLSQSAWRSAFRLEEPSGEVPRKALFVVNLVWLGFLDVVVTFLFSDLKCLDHWAYYLFFWGMMVCWSWTSMLLTQIIGAYAFFRTSTTLTYAEENIMGVRYVDRQSTCRLKRLYFGFAFMFTLFTAMLFFHFSRMKLEMFNSTCLSNITFANSTNVFPYIGQIDTWATINIFTIALVIPSIALFMVNVGTLCTAMCK